MLIEAALTGGQKVAATIGAKVVTAAAATGTSTAINNGIAAATDPNNEKRNTVKTKIREGAIAGLLSGIFLIGFKALEEMIENSDFI